MMIQRPTVLLLIPHLDGGGAERVFALLTSSLSCEKYSLHLATMTGAQPQSGTFPPSVTVHAIGALRVRGAALRLLKLIRTLQPHVVLSGMYHLNFLVLLLRPLFPRHTRIVVRENGTVSAVLESSKLPQYTGALYRWLYRRADRVICQSDAMADEFALNNWVARERITVLRNPVDVEAIRRIVCEKPLTTATSRWRGNGPNLLAIGRLSPEKGFDRLLEAFSEIRAQFSRASVIIAGAGSEEGALKEQCRRLGLETAVSFRGHLAQPAELYRGATVFVLSSWHEGMPNAMLEAAAGGLPIVAVPAAGGVPALLRDQPGVGLARENTTAGLAASLREALTTLQPGQRFKHLFLEPFRLERAVASYEQLIDAEVFASRRRLGSTAGSRL
jgi:glycosyltransferase involved in cell wall biosynthesis